MNNRGSFIHPAGVLTVALLFTNIVTFGGNLTPQPGPVEPTMKSLSDVEPRVAVQTLSGSGTALFVIDQPGSYYLTANVAGEPGKNGISITADNVTLDLNGFSVVGVPGSFSGITNPAGTEQGTVVHRGTVKDWGGSGVDLAGFCRVSGVHARSNQSHGIHANAFSVVENCTARENGGTGFLGSHDNVLVNCIASQNGVGFSQNSTSIIRSCIAHTNTGSGIILLKGGVITGVGTVTGCNSVQNGGVGIDIEGGGLVRNCSAIDNSGGGIDAPDSLVSGNVALGNAGFNIQGSGATFVENHAP